MIKINLIPDEYRQEKVTEVGKKESDLMGLVLKAIFITLSIFFVLYIFIVYIPLKNAKKTVKMEKEEIVRLDKKYSVSDESVKSEAQMKKQVKTLQRLKKTVVWSEKLNIISDSVPVQVQLTSLSLKQRQETAMKKMSQKVLKGGKYQVVTKEVEKDQLYYTLEIQGEVLAFGGEKLVGQLRDNLNMNPAFADDFEYIKLISILSKGEDRKVFSIRCRFNEAFAENITGKEGN